MVKVLKFIKPDTSIIDCSTIDVKTTIELHQLFNRKILNLDAPVSGGTIGAENGTSNFYKLRTTEAYEKLKLFLISWAKYQFIMEMVGQDNQQKCVIICY